jgi:hypothetical protein
MPSSPETAARAPRRAVSWALAAVAAWPVIHLVACRVWHLNPWKFGGWAMYAVPPPRVQLDVRILDGGEDWKSPAAIGGADAAHTLARCAARRREWGALFSPVDIARSMGRAVAAARGGGTPTELEVSIRERRFDGGQGRFQAIDAVYHCRFDADATTCRAASSPGAGHRRSPAIDGASKRVATEGEKR